MTLPAPNADEFEFSLFGPGRGECIVLHLGNNFWVIVDSCVSAGHSESVALEYLRVISVPFDQIRFVLATHWHDDHTKGLSSILRVADKALFGTSVAFRVAELSKLIAIADPVHRRSGIDEFATIVAVLAARRKAKAIGGLGEPVWAYPGRALLELVDKHRHFPVTVTSLSPSDASVRTALEEISAALPREREPMGVVRHRSPNANSIVLRVSAGETRLILGADLENTRRAGEGWTAVLALHDGVAARVLKVPHHGSENADSPDMWTAMLSHEPIAAIAPYSSGVSPLPSPSDLQRLSSRTPHVYCTARPGGTSPRRRDSLVEKQLKQLTNSRRVVSGACGHVRVRWRPINPKALPTIELFSGAFRATGFSAA